MSKGKIIYMVVPCYNEEEVLDETTKQLSDKLQKLIDAGEISEKSRILYVNDGSKDQTWPIICRLHEEWIESFQKPRTSECCACRPYVCEGSL